MRYSRIVATADGGTKFEDAEVPQELRSIGDNIPLVLASAPLPRGDSIRPFR